MMPIEFTGVLLQLARTQCTAQVHFKRAVQWLEPGSSTCSITLACVMVLSTVYSQSYQAIDSNKLLWALGPRWQLHIRHHAAVLHHSQVVTVGIDKHLGEVVELWDQLLHGHNIETYLNLGYHHQREQKVILSISDK